GDAYGRALGVAPDHPAALAGAGAIALLHNQLDAAVDWLGRAVERAPDDVRAMQHLAEAAYRRDDFAAGAAWRRRLATVVDGDDRHDVEVVARKLEAFGASAPYEIRWPAPEVRVPMVATDPLPVLEVTLGGSTVPFFLDTGAEQVYLDQALAASLQVATFGETAQQGAGGKQGTTVHGRLDALTIGGLPVRNLPVKILDFRALGFPESWMGTIGTGFLRHFRSTIDYPGGTLVLRPRSGPDAPTGDHTVPFWLAGTHYVLVEARINNGEPVLLFADTGGTGVALYATNDTVERARIPLRHDLASRGTGAAGAVRTVPFVVDELSVGDITGHDLPGVATPDSDPASTLQQDGLVERAYRIGGFVSHQFFRPYAVTLDFDRMHLSLRTA
ncbi:MAG: aspartyl protease family protein, partial [Pseudonocardia sp.]